MRIENFHICSKEVYIMAEIKHIKQVEWMCTQCGKKMIKSELAGRPQPGSCPKLNGRAHRWVKNRVR